MTDEEVERALTENARAEQRDGKAVWYFAGAAIWSSPPRWHSDAQARAIVRFCLMLDRPVTDVLTSELFGALVDEIALLRDAVYRLGGTFR